MVQVPVAMKVAVDPDIVHTPVVAEVKVTGRPELAVAERVNGVPTAWDPGLAKVMVCVACVTVTGGEVPVARP
jgi:hypothetical protein